MGQGQCRSLAIGTWGAFPGEPLADWLWQVLIEMGIYANLEVEIRSPATRFETFDDAMGEYTQRLNCTTPEQEEIVKNYLHSVLRKEESGYSLGDTVLGAHIWWNTSPQVQEMRPG